LNIFITNLRQYDLKLEFKVTKINLARHTKN